MNLGSLRDALFYVVRNRKEHYFESAPYVVADDPTDLWNPSTEAATEFLHDNRQYWDEFFQPIVNEFDGNILLDVSVGDIKELHNRCMFGNYLAKARKLEPVFLFNDIDKKRAAIVNSYYPGDIVTLAPSEVTNRTFAGCVVNNVRRYRELESVEDLIDTSFDSIQVGDLVYNTTMKQTGAGSFDQLTGAPYERLFLASLFYNRAKGVFEKHDIKATHLHHVYYIRGGILARLALAGGADVYVGHQEKCKLYGSYSMRDSDMNRTSQQLFDHVYESKRQEAIEQAERIMRHRFGIGPDAYRSRSGEERATPTLTDDFAIDPSKPTALVMPQIFVEHLRHYDDMLFRDFLTWYRETLRFIKDVDGVNWLIKQHPNRESFDMKHDAVSEARAIIGDLDESPVTMLPPEVAHSALLQEVDAVITMDGTGGLEYSCYGIPCILASKSPYSGFGFTHEPKTRSEYFELLSSIDGLSRLTPEEVTRAKVVCYIYFDLIRNNPDFSNQGPDYPTNGRSEWERATEFRRRLEVDAIYSKVEDFVNEGKTHFIDPERL